MDEVAKNYGTLKKAWEWAGQKGLITFTWHWFSPLYGHAKSFYADYTDFDADKAVIDGTPENIALISDMDVMAGLLRPFCEKQIPILWRPFHEGDGDWFWWGRKGPDALKKLWRIMYERYTNVHKLNNLIWVWNSPVAECYPGDDVTDIISMDIYSPAHEHTSQGDNYQNLIQITSQPKITLIGETGTLPSPAALMKEKTGWASYMTWSHEFCTSENYNTYEILKEMYNSPYAVTLDQLPELY